MAKIKGTNVNPTGAQKGPVAVDPSHPGQILPKQPPGGPYYKQKGANG